MGMNLLSAMASYLMVFIVFVLVIGVAVFLGITLRKSKNLKEGQTITEENVQ